MEEKVKSCLLIVFSIVVIALIAYNLYLGVTVQKIGIPGIFEISFGTKPERPSGTSQDTPIPPVQIPSDTPSGPPLLSAVISTIEDSNRLYAFMIGHIAQRVSLNIRFVPREDGGITDLDHTVWMEWVGNGRQQQAYDITIDKECALCKLGVYDHLILRIENSGPYNINEDLVLSGTFSPAWVNDVGQGYTVAYLVPSP